MGPHPRLTAGQAGADVSQRGDGVGVGPHPRLTAGQVGARIIIWGAKVIIVGANQNVH